MTRIATLAAAVLLTAQGAFAASLGLSGTEIYKFDASAGFELEFFGPSALIAGPAIPEIGGGEDEELYIDLDWTPGDPTDFPGGGFEVFDPSVSTVFPVLDGIVDQVGWTAGVIEVLYDTGVYALIDLLDMGLDTAADPFAEIEALADGTFVSAEITLYEQTPPVPLPATLPMAVAALGGLALMGRRCAA